MIGGIRVGELPPLIFATTSIEKSMFVSSRDKIEQHLIKQKARAVEVLLPEHPTFGQQAPRCQYRNEQGQMCAAGCVIPEEKYQKSMEGQTAMQLAYSHPDVFPDDISLRELEMWQAYHDHTCMQGGILFSYGKWCEGDEEHHPSKFKSFVAESVKRHNL